MRRILFTLLCICALISCKKEEDSTDNNNNGNNNQTPSGFTAPTSNYWKINGTNNSSSAEIVSVHMNGRSMGINRPFTDLNYGYCQLRVFNFNNNLNIRDDVPEGGYKIYPITPNSTDTNDSLRIDLDVQDQNTETNGMYFYKAMSGNIYVSKLNGKLRYTTDGVLQLSGVKYPDMQSYLYSCSLEFSQAEP
jgi:hypothetical protein